MFFEVFGHVTSSVDRCNMSQWRIQFPESAILPSRPFEGYEDVVSSAKLLCIVQPWSPTTLFILVSVSVWLSEEEKKHIQFIFKINNLKR